MLNLTLLNKALTDTNITDAEFRLLYLIANNISMSKADEKEIYNGFLMDKLNLSERQIQRLTKSLADKGYITKRAIGNKRNKHGNIYSLAFDVIASDTSSDTESVKNDTLYKNIKEKKNLLVNSCTTEENSNTNLRKCEVIDDIPFDMDEAATDTPIQEVSASERIRGKETDRRNMGYTYTEEELRAANSQAIEEWKQIEETRIGEHQTVNVWVGKILNRGYDLLRSFEKSKTKEGALAYSVEICELIGKMNKAVEANTLTDGQYKAFEKFCNSYHRAADNKEAYLARGVQMKGKQPQSEKEADETTIQLEKEQIEKAAPCPQTLSEDDVMRMAKEAKALYDNWDLQRFTEVDEQCRNTIKANGTSEQMGLYLKLTA